MAADKKSPARVVCVLGMHRSGTSAITRLLNLLGVYLGQEKNLIPAGFDNPRGFWEHQFLTSLNEEILAHFGGHHLAPPEFPLHWQTLSELNPYKVRAREFIQEEFGATPLWGWKDPRNSLTLPFWQQLLPAMSYVICLRNPSDVALSLERRQGLPFEKGVDLWFVYARSALAQTSGKHRLLLFYEDLIEELRGESQRLFHFISGHVAVSKNGVASEIERFVDAGLQHHRSSVVDTLRDPRLSLAVRCLYADLRLSVNRAKRRADLKTFIDEAVEPMLESYAVHSDVSLSAAAGATADVEAPLIPTVSACAARTPITPADKTSSGKVPEFIFVGHDASRAGAQQLLLTLLRWLRDKRALRMKIILRRGGPLLEKFRELGPVLEIEPLLANGINQMQSKVLEFSENAVLAYINTLVPGDIAAILSDLSIPIVTHAHEMEQAIQSSCTPEHLDALLRVTDFFISASPMVSENLQARYGVDANRMSTIYPFICCSSREIGSCDKKTSRRRNNLPDDGFLVFGCGSVEWRKGPDLFVEIAGHVINDLRLPEIHFCWIGSNGSPAELQKLRDRASELRIEKHVQFIGEVIDPREYFAGGDAFLLTSREDPFPLVCLEAADSGLPIVCFDGAGGIGEFVKHDAGYVVPFGNLRVAAERVGLLYADRAHGQRLGAAACQRVRENFDVSSGGEQIFKVLMTVRTRRKRKTLARQPEWLRNAFERERQAWQAERSEAVRQVKVLTEEVRSAELYAHSLEAERTAAVKSFQKVEAYAKSLFEENERLQSGYASERSAREMEGAAAIEQINLLTNSARNAETYAKSLLDEVKRLEAEIANFRKHWVFRLLKHSK